MKERLKYMLGMLFAQLFPARAAEMYRTFTVPEFRDGRLQERIDRLIHYYLIEQAVKNESDASGELEDRHKHFWASTGNYYENTATLTEELYVPIYEDMIGEVAQLLQKNGAKNVYEFGTGDGRWLNHLTQQWPFIERFVGVDISESQVAKNRETFPHIEFYTADLVEWVADQGTSNALYHTNGGVLEYLSEESVRRLIQLVKTRGGSGSVVYFNEPVYGSFDLEHDKKSQIIGIERSYSHNHKYLLESAGFVITHQDERDMYGLRFILIVAYLP